MKKVLLSLFMLVAFLLPAAAAKPQPPLYDLQPNAIYQVSVYRVVDGDTIFVDFPIGERERIRLISVTADRDAAGSEWRLEHVRDITRGMDCPS